jgi:hypothetical protein
VLRIAALALVATATLLITAADAALAREPGADFHTPGHAVLCGRVVDITGDNPAYVPWLFCWTPNDGFTIWLHANGTPRHATHHKYKWHYERSPRALTFGSSWWLNRAGRAGFNALGAGDVLIRCISHASGLTCTNRADHGFWLRRYRGYRVF